MRRPFLTPLLVLVVVVAGCRNASSEAESFKGLFGSDRKAVDQWFPAVVKRSDGNEKFSPGSLVTAASNEVVDFQIALKAEDSPGLFRVWAGMSDAELMAPNPDVVRGGFREGEAFTLRMTRDQFERFSAKRDLYHQKRAQARERGETVIREVVHVVAQGESLEDIVQRYPTGIDLILRSNPELRMRLPYEGQRITVPIVEEVQDERRERPAE